MSGGILIVVGLFLCLAGAWSVRLTVLAAGFGVTGLGRLDPDQFEALYLPEDATERTFLAVAWLALGLLGRAAQQRLPSRD